MGSQNCRDRHDMMLLPRVSYSLRDVIGLRECVRFFFFPDENPRTICRCKLPTTRTVNFPPSNVVCCTTVVALRLCRCHGT